MRRKTPAGSTALPPDSAAVVASFPMADPPDALRKLTVVIPARGESGCIASTVEHLHLELRLHGIDHEIIVVDDGSDDGTGDILQAVATRIPNLVPLRNDGPHGFGRAIQIGLEAMTADAVVIMMADESDDCRDVVRYWRLLQEGYDCVFGSRFIRGGGVIDYPRLKYLLNRLANLFIGLIFRIGLNDTTNAFKAYRREVIDGCRPLLAPHFKAIVRGYSWTTMPITWRNRRSGVAKLRIREMGSRYFFIVAYVWLEKYFARGDYHRQPQATARTVPSPVAGGLRVAQSRAS
jgi:dolichol-phosphate mannosyltransferase